MAAPKVNLGRLTESPEAVDRALVVACAVVWLLVLGFAVAAGVALVDLGRGRTADGGGDTPWLLYAVIAVSAVVIAAAIPLLMRARRETPGEAARPARRSPEGQDALVDRDPPGYPGPTPARYAANVISAGELDRMWLRCGLGVLTATGFAMMAVAIATHLMAADLDTAAWSSYAVAGVIAVAMVAIPLLYLRQLKSALNPD